MLNDKSNKILIFEKEIEKILKKYIREPIDDKLYSNIINDIKIIWKKYFPEINFYNIIKFIEIETIDDSLVINLKEKMYETGNPCRDI